MKRRKIRIKSKTKKTKIKGEIKSKRRIRS